MKILVGLFVDCQKFIKNSCLIVEAFYSKIKKTMIVLGNYFKSRVDCIRQLFVVKYYWNAYYIAQAQNN